MTRHFVVGAALVLASGTAHAAGIERSRTPIDMLFEEGRQMRFALTSVSPEVSGEYPAALGGGSTGDMAGSYVNATLAFRDEIRPGLDAVVSLAQPYSAHSTYEQGIYSGLRARWHSTSLTALLRYGVTDRISVYGGPRLVSSRAEIDIPPALIFAATGNPVPYTARGAADTRLGYVVGAAYERPDIALRVGLTYESAIVHKFDTTETVGSASFTGTTRVEMPQSLTFDFQTGIARDTLLFGSVRWSEWSKWEVAPPVFAASAGRPITSFDTDVYTWTLGVGRRIDDRLSVFARASYEDHAGIVASRLSPTDGYSSLGLGGTYTLPNETKITAGVEYVSLGDTTDSSGTRFEGNSALALGVQVNVKF
jgi:long-subunit fatty acid transport protein